MLALMSYVNAEGVKPAGASPQTLIYRNVSIVTSILWGLRLVGAYFITPYSLVFYLLIG